MGDSNAYKILLQAAISGESIKAELNNISKTYVLKLGIQIDSANLAGINTQLKGIQQKLGTGGKGINLINEKDNKIALAAFQKKMLEIQDSAAKIQKTVKTTDANANLVKGAITYSEKTGQTVAATMKWDTVQKQVNGELVKSNEFITTQVRTTQKASSETSFLGKQFQNVFQNVMQWASATAIIFGVMQQFKEGIQYVQDLNKEMTNIRVLQVDGAKSAAEIENLANQFNGLAQNMGVTTLEVAKGSVEWLLIRSL